MKKWLGWLGVGVAGLTLLSCGSSQRLVSIAVTPIVATFLSPDATLRIQLTATGTYTHPPATKDITDQVTWASSVPGLVTVSNAGVIAPAGAGECGLATVTGSLLTNDPTGNVVSNNMAVTVDDITNPICPQPGH
jgi:hypothetical protein